MKGCFIMKLTKKITAMGTAVMMLASMSAIGASADNSYNLHYTKGAPSSATVCEQWVYGFEAHYNGYLKSNCTSYNIPSNNVDVLVNGYRASSHSIYCGSFDIWNTGTSNWSHSNFKKGYSYDAVVEFGMNGGFINIGKYVSNAYASGNFT